MPNPILGLKFPYLMAAALFMAPAFCLQAADVDDELVVVDQDDLSAYWRADERRAQSMMLSGEGAELYGCMAMPFVIEPDGRVSPGRRPLLVKTGRTASPAGADSATNTDGIYALMMGSLPPYRLTWDRRPDSAIYSSRAMVFGDARIRRRLGDEKWFTLHEALERACRIDGLAAWLQRSEEKTVEQQLPASPEQFLQTQSVSR